MEKGASLRTAGASFTSVVPQGEAFLQLRMKRIMSLSREGLCNRTQLLSVSAVNCP